MSEGASKGLLEILLGKMQWPDSYLNCKLDGRAKRLGVGGKSSKEDYVDFIVSSFLDI